MTKTLQTCKQLLHRKCIWFLLLTPCTLLLKYWSTLDPQATESYYATGFYAIYAQSMSTVFSLIPFSVAEFLLVGGAGTLLVYTALTILHAIGKHSLYPFITYCINIGITSSIVFFLFMISCGMNYERLDFVTYYPGEPRTYSIEELSTMCQEYIKIASNLREELVPSDFQQSPYVMSAHAGEAFHTLGEQYPVLSGSYSDPKPIILSSLMSHTEITGFFFPVTTEANVNVDIPAYQIPFTMLHEQAHQRGFMQENEANFIAFLAGKDSPNVFIQYSVYMSAINYALNSLSRTDYDAFLTAYSHLSELQLADRAESRSYWKQFEDKVISDTFTTVNDNYLKVNGQWDGVASYGKVTELLLLDYYTTHP